jgi:hypothetical protein
LAVNLIQRHYRFRTDALAVNDPSPVWGAVEDTGGFVPALNTPFRLRFTVTNTGSSNSASSPWRLYLSKNAGAYAQITTTSTGGVKAVDAGSSADRFSPHHGGGGLRASCRCVPARLERGRIHRGPER